MDSMIPQAQHSGGAETVLGLKSNSSITVVYHSMFGSHDDLMLLELDEKLLNEVMNGRVTIRGNPDEDAVLCTNSKTYAIKFVGTSNSVFLIPPIDIVSHEDSDDKEDGNMAIAPVIKLAPGCMELVEVAPRLDRLKLLLSRKPYTFGKMSETVNFFNERDRMNIGLYTWDDLVQRLQASDEELRLGLESIWAVEIDGYWRVVDEKYMNSIVNMLLHNVVLNDWSIYSLNGKEVLNMLELDGFPRIIASHCLKIYCSKVDDDDTWKLNERRVCVCLAREILSEGKMKFEVFMEKWIGKVPNGVIASFDMLEGEVLTEKIGMESWVYLFSLSSLPLTPRERFFLLFKERPRWEWKDLEPYVRDLRVPGLSSEGLLLKYTRRNQPNAEAEPVFSAR